MYATESFNGHQVNLILSKDGQHIRAATVMVGPPDKPGWRSKDFGSRELRKAAKADVLAAMANDPRAAGVDPSKIRVRSRYSCLSASPDGTIVRLDDAGNTIGVYL